MVQFSFPVMRGIDDLNVSVGRGVRRYTGICLLRALMQGDFGVAWGRGRGRGGVFYYDLW